MHLCLFEDDRVAHLRPLVLTRAVYDLRLGIRTILQTARETLGDPPLLLHARRRVAAVTAQEYDALVNRIADGLGVLFVNGRCVLEEGPFADRLLAAAREREGRVFVQGEDVVAAWVPHAANRLVAGDAVTRAGFEGFAEEEVDGVPVIGRLWHLLDAIHPAIVRDFTARTGGYRIFERPGATIQEGVRLVESERIFIAPGAKVCAGTILDATEGPIYIDRDALVLAGAVLIGPVYVGPHAQVKPLAMIEGSALGPWVKAGGEIGDSVLHSLANKVHAGHLGDAYLGRWCNIGAGTDNSNLRNDYGPVTLYDEALGEEVDTGRQFVGLFMGDHSKCGIGSMFNTGTVVGVNCNLYGAGFMPRYVPSFSWGGPDGLAPYRIDKALRVAEAVMARRNHALTDADRDLLTALYEESTPSGLRPSG